MTPRIVYLAGPLFSDQDRGLLLEIEAAFLSEGLTCFVPHREVGDLATLKNQGDEDTARTFVFDSDIKGLKQCHVVCALLDGTDVDSGTAAEIGYAHALEKRVFGLCTDKTRRGKTLNNVIWGICGNGNAVYSSISEVTRAVADSLKGIQIPV